MGSKFEIISELANKTSKKIASNPREWKAFLKVAAQIYKYPFTDQLLIYAQRPEVTACASITIWNRRMNRWVKRGAKGIALIDTVKSKPRLKYVFDVKDTCPGKNAVNPKIWQLRNEHHDAVIKNLESIYGAANGSFAGRIADIAEAAAEEMCGEFLNDLIMSKGNSFLEDLDDLNTEVFFRNTVTASVQYIILTRCGIDADEYVSDDDLNGIVNFNTEQTLSYAGHASSTISEQVLRQIERQVKVFNRKIKPQTLENEKGTGYNKFSALKRNTLEEANDNGTDIYEKRGLPDSKPKDGRTAGGRTRQVRENEGEIPQRTQERNVHINAAERETLGTPLKYRQNSSGENGKPEKRNGDTAGHKRETERVRPNALGTGDEQHTGTGGGNSRKRDNIQLSFFPTVEEQIEQLSLAEDEKPSAFSIPQQDIIRALCEGSGFEGGKFRITNWFEGQHRNDDTVKFLKDEYGTGGQTFTLSDGLSGSLWFDAEGFFLSHGIDTVNPEIKLTWESVAGKLHDLILSGRYLTPEESEQYQKRSRPELASPGVSTEAEPRTNTINQALNFRITDGNLGAGGQKTKYGYNIAAIRALKTIEANGRTATPEEQKTLSRYVGWGGIPQVFDEKNEKWAKEYAELKENLTDEEYKAARASVLNAHYTSPTVIKAIYDAIDSFDWKPGNILEPAMGVGNFFGLMPDSMEKSKLYGVELDSITGRIAKQLYPKADITVDGFENTAFPDDFFDLALGNVPFGEYQIADRRYDKYKFHIHDYFFAKTIDKIRPGGLIAFITSKGTMDKQNPEVRKYIAARADLLGAIRLPNNAFLKNAGTEVTADILFLQKRSSLSSDTPKWLEIGTTADGMSVNQYYLSHPDMLLGTMTHSERMYGDKNDTTCAPIEGADLAEQLKAAMQEISMPDIGLLNAHKRAANGKDTAMPADPNVRNFSFTEADNKLYFRKNSMMEPADAPDSAGMRIRGMVKLRDSVRKLISLELNNCDDNQIEEEQENLNKLYDCFTGTYGLINNRSNKNAFEQDSSYYLLCSLEILNEDGSLKRKADMFTKRTIRPTEKIMSVETASEALAVSMAEKACVDIGYMCSLCGKSEDEIEKDLSGVIFVNPEASTGIVRHFETADEYLSGNVRNKLIAARKAAESNPDFKINVEALEKVQPEELDASQIDVRLGASWVGTKYIDQFMYETFDTPQYFQGDDIKTLYSPVSGVWNITGKGADSADNILVYTKYGTARRNAYYILEDTLNQKTTRIFDTIFENGQEKRVPNKKETAIAQQKQELIKNAFSDWIFKDPKRREALCAKYNKIFNSTRQREYDGGHLTFPGMNPEIRLRPHQLNAVAHILYGRNTLLAHCVGAGKTFEMAAAAMESKRIGLCHKSMFVVPNHLTEQWGSDFLRLYPGANILVATKKDFTPQNRKTFCARISTGDYDAVIIGHSQFEKIPVSKERQINMIHEQISQIEEGIKQLQNEHGEQFTIKQMEKTRKSLEARLERLNNDDKKDDVVTFEELGVDRLFVDEADSFKNLFLYTKMRNVAGIGQTNAQKSSDMYMKCRYMDELTGGHGIIFATGTPISNSMTELYTMMRYLQNDTLQKHDLGFFDSWAADFGETVTATELAPEGTGFRVKTRFARFFNLPELMNMWKETADIQTADMLHLPVPDAEYINVVTQPSDFQKEGVQSLAERAEAVRNNLVEPFTDNMLKITGDGRRLALDQRLMNPLLPDDSESKVNMSVKNILQIYEETQPEKGAQLVFCDLSTPHYDGSFNVYDDIKNKLMESGISTEEIAFIHDANTEAQKTDLFAKVRSGQVRILLGSTSKMGAGTNVQDRLAALHHLDCPWKPRDIEQREGRILRQGNINKKVRIFRYVTKGTFDSYSWQLIENKQKFISQVMSGKSPARSCEDVDESVLSYAEVKALATGDPRIKEKMDLDVQVTKLKMLKAGFESQHYLLEDNLLKKYPDKMCFLKEHIAGLESDIKFLSEQPPMTPKSFEMIVNGMEYTDKKEAGMALINTCGKLKALNPTAMVGTYRGFDIKISFRSLTKVYIVSLKHNATHTSELGTDPLGNITRMNNIFDSFPKQLESKKRDLETLNRQIDEAKTELTKTFPQAQELEEKNKRLNKLTIELSDKGKENTELPVTENNEPSNLAGRIQNARQVSTYPFKKKETPQQEMEVQT